MSSRLRYIVQVGSGWYAGPDARLRLSLHSGLPTRTKNDMVYAAKQIGAHLWIFREPRNIKKKQSRYKMLCEYLGIRAKHKRPRLPNLQGVLHAGNPKPRPARAPNGAIAAPAVAFNHPNYPFNDPF